MTPERCERELHDMATKTSPIVRFMLEKMAEAGCAIDSRFFRVETCSERVVGGFRPPDGIVMCHNQIHDRTTMENMLAHELVHAYDQCRGGKKMNWLDLKQHACSEIRAANLSGDCHWLNELMRGRVFVNVHKHHQKCVRRRAELSVAMNPNCKSAKHAEEVVNEVFETCFRDTAPYDDIP
jgi:inner membrane protease ATP23